MARKSAEAFRTISEVADLIGTPAHVLRFWESKFTQVRPVKRAGGRRYYRPDDVALLDGIRRLLHEDGVTIRGVQKILKEQGQRHVLGLSALSGGAVAEPAAPVRAAAPAPAPVRAAETQTDAPTEAETAAETETPAKTAAAAPPEPEPPRPAPPRRPAIHRPARGDDDRAPELPFGAAPTPAAPAPTPAVPADAAAPAAPEAPVPLSVRLRHLPDGHLGARAAALAPLQARIAALHARMQAAQSQSRG